MTCCELSHVPTPEAPVLKMGDRESGWFLTYAPVEKMIPARLVSQVVRHGFQIVLAEKPATASKKYNPNSCGEIIIVYYATQAAHIIYIHKH